jgi:hypothetical protein
VVKRAASVLDVQDSFRGDKAQPRNNRRVKARAPESAQDSAGVLARRSPLRAEANAKAVENVVKVLEPVSPARSPACLAKAAENVRAAESGPDEGSAKGGANAPDEASAPAEANVKVAESVPPVDRVRAGVPVVAAAARLPVRVPRAAVRILPPDNL